MFPPTFYKHRYKHFDTHHYECIQMNGKLYPSPFSDPNLRNAFLRHSFLRHELRRKSIERTLEQRLSEKRLSIKRILDEQASRIPDHPLPQSGPYAEAPYSKEPPQ